jgi:hypothetical protein
VPINEAAVPIAHKLRVFVKVERNAQPPQGSTAIQATCSDITTQDQTLKADVLAVFEKACAAALQGGTFYREIGEGLEKTEFDVVTVKGRKVVRMLRGEDVYFKPEEGAMLKESLAQAAVAEAWYKQLLQARTLPVKTAAAHPPKTASYYLHSKVGEVPCDGMDYEISLEHHLYFEPPNYSVTHILGFNKPDGSRETNGGTWVERLQEQVALALKAAAKNEAFTFAAPETKLQSAFTVTANLATQKADVSFNPGSFEVSEPPVHGSIGAAQLAAIRELVTQAAARGKWFAEHEAWFFERE